MTELRVRVGVERAASAMFSPPSQPSPLQGGGVVRDTVRLVNPVEMADKSFVPRPPPALWGEKGGDGGKNIALAARSTPTLTLPRRGGGNRYFLTQ